MGAEAVRNCTHLEWFHMTSHEQAASRVLQACVPTIHLAPSGGSTCDDSSASAAGRRSSRSPCCCSSSSPSRPRTHRPSRSWTAPRCCCRRPSTPGAVGTAATPAPPRRRRTSSAPASYVDYHETGGEPTTVVDRYPFAPGQLGNRRAE